MPLCVTFPPFLSFGGTVNYQPWSRLAFSCSLHRRGRVISSRVRLIVQCLSLAYPSASDLVFLVFRRRQCPIRSVRFFMSRPQGLRFKFPLPGFFSFFDLFRKLHRHIFPILSSWQGIQFGARRPIWSLSATLCWSLSYSSAFLPLVVFPQT